ncbi:nitronate monooxygenase [Sesbania bispinosa]|nr:nitronate monooxygenase [Sesbania bispinosa]
MDHTRRTGSRVSHKDPVPSSSPNRYVWVNDGVRDATSVVSEDAAATYLASLPEPPSFELIRPNMEARVCDRLSPDFTKDCLPVFYPLLPTSPNSTNSDRKREMFVDNLEECFLSGGCFRHTTTLISEGIALFTMNSGQLSPNLGLLHFGGILGLDSRSSIECGVANHFYMTSSKYYVLRNQLPHVQETFLKTVEEVEAAKGRPFSCEEILDVAEDDVIALLLIRFLSGASAHQVDRPSPKRPGRGSFRPKKLLHRPILRMLLGSSYPSEKGKEKRKEPNSPRKHSSLDTTKRLLRTEGQGGSETLVVPIKESQGQVGFGKALKELEETKLKLKEAESSLDAWNEKYENVVTRHGPEAYYNTVEHLKVLNSDLIVTGSDLYAYVINGIIMEDSQNGPIPFEEGVGDSNPNPNQGVLKEPVQKEDSQIASKTSTGPNG